jgi:hypoxanthine phosphoribosyltransferase
VRDPGFAHAAERECAQLLDFYGISWEYEPTTFTLAVDAEGRTRQAFTPDFYLPDLDCYLEVTTMRQRHVTRKHRKLKRLRECHPEVRILLFSRRDVERLAACHGILVDEVA